MDPYIALLTVIGIVVLLAVIVAVWLVSRQWPSRTGSEGMIGKFGVSVDLLDPTGDILLEGEYWKARADREVRPGASVQVTGIKGLVLLVTPAEEEF